ncbi:hypothetical protein LMG28688_06492 [Paraburkholderia caffeinitolerans]|uniref:Uncharacterized protein n=1 Tax=Paraburkholderia caffeinitolerans TaxID=1723730 RepID=A0A6J5GVT7_9BURK|nr:MULTISPECIES: hypothetical protein [Paraburkholderia]CAB3807145.1 hypothetical protein LMG28688_06492 [Paraburkholderia caffeinitolerans]
MTKFKTKVQDKVREPRVLYMSWVPDDDQMAKSCVDIFLRKLKVIPRDAHDVPISVIDSCSSRLAGDQNSIPAVREVLHGITDFIGFFSDYYFCGTEWDDQRVSCEIDYIVQRKKAEKKAGVQVDHEPELAIWFGFVTRVEYWLVGKMQESRKLAWHKLNSGKPYSSDKDTRLLLNDEVHKSVKALLQHEAEHCDCCLSARSPAKRGGLSAH